MRLISPFQGLGFVLTLARGGAPSSLAPGYYIPRLWRWEPQNKSTNLDTTWELLCRIKSLRVRSEGRGLLTVSTTTSFTNIRFSTLCKSTVRSSIVALSLAAILTNYWGRAHTEVSTTMVPRIFPRDSD